MDSAACYYCRKCCTYACTCVWVHACTCMQQAFFLHLGALRGAINRPLKSALLIIFNIVLLSENSDTTVSIPLRPRNECCRAAAVLEKPRKKALTFI